MTFSSSKQQDQIHETAGKVISFQSFRLEVSKSFHQKKQRANQIVEKNISLVVNFEST